MKYRISVLTALILFFALSSVQAQQIQSDYEIQKNFRAKYEHFEKKLKRISSPDSVQVVMDSIRVFDNTYRPHIELLNLALYPETYDERMNELKDLVSLEKTRVSETEKQTKKIQTMEKKIVEYENDFQRLTGRADSLQLAIEKSIESEKRLSEMLRRYRLNLEKRDKLILAFIDSMVIAHQQIGQNSINTPEDVNKESRLDSNGDALETIHQITLENLAILEKNVDRLRIEDYMRMIDVQQRFGQMWNRLGNDISDVYDNEEADTLGREIDNNITQWNEQLKNQTVATLKDSLRNQNIEFTDFENSEEFYISLKIYLDKQIKESKDGASPENSYEFQQFQQFWDNIALSWSSNLVEAGIISAKQIESLNKKVNRWYQQVEAEPRSNIIAYLLGVSVLLVLVLGGLLIREREKTIY